MIFLFLDWKSTSHKPSFLFLQLCMTILSFLKIYSDTFVKSVIQLSSQSCPIDNKDSLVIFV